MKKGIIILVIIAIAVIGIVFLKRKKDAVAAANTISSLTGTPPTNYLSLGLGFLQVWAAAVLAKQPDFTYNGIGYDTHSGTSLGSSGD